MPRTQRRSGALVRPNDVYLCPRSSRRRRRRRPGALSISLSLYFSLFFFPLSHARTTHITYTHTHTHATYTLFLACPRRSRSLGPEGGPSSPRKPRWPRWGWHDSPVESARRVGATHSDEPLYFVVDGWPECCFACCCYGRLGYGITDRLTIRSVFLTGGRSARGRLFSFSLSPRSGFYYSRCSFPIFRFVPNARSKVTRQRDRTSLRRWERLRVDDKRLS